MCFSWNCWASIFVMHFVRISGSNADRGQTLTLRILTGYKLCCYKFDSHWANQLKVLPRFFGGFFLSHVIQPALPCQTSVAWRHYPSLSLSLFLYNRPYFKKHSVTAFPWHFSSFWIAISRTDQCEALVFPIFLTQLVANPQYFFVLVIIVPLFGLLCQQQWKWNLFLL